MFFKLLEYNWNVFKNSLKGITILVFLVYGTLLCFLFFNTIGVLASILFVQDNTQLYKQYEWLTPERARFILLLFANGFWVAQLVFTNVRQLQLEENRKLLTVGFPAKRLARYLVLVGFFHPLNLLFNATWIFFLYAQYPTLSYLPLILITVLVNYGIIFSLKFRFLKMVKVYHKWILLFSLIAIFLLSGQIKSYLTPGVFKKMDMLIPTLNSVGNWLPGGLLQQSVYFSSSFPGYATLSLFSCIGIFYLFEDHFLHTRKALQTFSTSEYQNGASTLWKRLHNWFGLQAGKYLFYVSSHPYNRVQALFFILFPVFYIPLATWDIPAGNEFTYHFTFLFFMMYIPLGFLMLCVGNIFGYEHRELLLHMQFPVRTKKLIGERYWGAVFLPLAFFCFITLLELIMFFHAEHIVSYIIGNFFIFLCLLLLFSWSAFNQFKKIPWVSFTFTQPVISKSVAMVTGLLMVFLCLIAYLPFGNYEPYKQIFLCIGILFMGTMLYISYNKQHLTFKKQILPQLWTEL